MISVAYKRRNCQRVKDTTNQSEVHLVIDALAARADKEVTKVLRKKARKTLRTTKSSPPRKK
jgi:hypothetical protein